MESTSARVRAEMQQQEAQASLAAMRRSLKASRQWTSLRTHEETEGRGQGEDAHVEGMQAREFEDYPKETLLFHCYSPSSSPED